MSWNTRRFVDVVARSKLATTDTRSIWITGSGLERIGSAWQNNVLEFTAQPLPPGGLAVGVAGISGEVKPGVVIACPQTGGGFLVNALDIHRNSLFRFVTTPDGSSSALPWVVVNNQPMSPDQEPAKALTEFALVMLKSAWTLFNEPVESDVTATTVQQQSVSTSKKPCRGQTFNVSVIDVRRPAGVRYLPSGRHIEHDHRWSVRGHWRNQPFGPGREQRRRIWIDEHVAGPDDKPLLNRPRVYRIS